MPPDYYRTTNAADLYDLWRQHYGTETACRHLEMSAQEYLYRAPKKGSYLGDLAKVQTIVQRLLAWGGQEGHAIVETPLSLDDMVTVLSSYGYLVRSPDADLEPLLEALARQYGYGLVRPADPTQPDPPQPAIVSHAALTQRMAQAIDHRDEALAAQNGERITLHEDRIQATQAAEDAEEVYCRALAEDIVRVGTEIDQWMHALRKEKPFPRAAETVLAHCVATDQARQGVAVATEIRALLAKHRIPADSPYGDWSSELAKHEPQRWPDTTAQEGPGGHAGEAK